MEVHTDAQLQERILVAILYRWEYGILKRLQAERLKGDYMGKSNTYIKREKYIKRFVLVVILIQVFIVLVFLPVFFSAMPIRSEDCINDVIVVDRKERVREYGIKWQDIDIYIYSNDVKYSYSNPGVFGEYSANEFYDEIYEGQRLNIIYRKSENWFSKANILMEVKSEDKTYLDFDDYKSMCSLGLTCMLILASIIEVIFLAVAVFASISQNSELKFFGRNKMK